METWNRHHALFPRRLHEVNINTRELRRTHSLIPKLQVVGHMALHDTIEFVPPLDRITAAYVMHDFEPVDDDSIKSIEQLMLSIERAANNAKGVGVIGLANAELAVYALELQLPFIKEYQVEL